MQENKFQEKMIALVRAFGWHRPMETPCGQPVSIAEGHALLEISQAEGISQIELAARLNLAKSTVSRLVTKVVSRGWVTREQNQQDRRAYHLSLAPQGEQVASQLAKARQAKMANVFAEIPPEQRAEVLGSIDILVKAIQAGEENASEFN